MLRSIGILLVAVLISIDLCSVQVMAVMQEDMPQENDQCGNLSYNIVYSNINFRTAVTLIG